MGTQGPGRRRIPNLEKLTAEDDALNDIAREAEARLAAKRAARAEAREIRMKELERQQKELYHSHKEDSERYSRLSRRHASISDDEEKMSVGSRGSLRPSDYSGVLGSGSRASSRASSARASPVVEERPDRDFIDKGSRTASTLSAATLASLGGASSRRGSCDTSFSVETEASIRDIKDSLTEMEERYRRAMVSNAQLHNDKSTLMYQVETLKEELSDLEELLWEARRTCDDRSKEVERQRQASSVLQFQLNETTETLRRTEELLTEVSQLRLQSSSFSQQISDLQETLEWKQKRIVALERQREISDIVQIERDRLRGEVVRLRDLLKEHGVVFSDDVTTNGETGQNDAEDDVSTQSASRLAQEASHGGRESMLGKVRDPQTSAVMSGMRSEPHLGKKSRTNRHHLSTRGANVQSVEETEPIQPASVHQDVLQVENQSSFHDNKHKNPRGSRAFTDQPQCDEGFQTNKTHKTRLVPSGLDGDVILENKLKEHKIGQTPSSYQHCPQKWTSSSNQRFWNEDNNAEIFSNQPKELSQTSRTKESPNDTSPSQSPNPDLNEDRFKDGTLSESLHFNNQTEDKSSGRGDHDVRSPSVLIQTFTNRIILEELLRRFLKHQNFADEILQTFPEMSESLHWRISGLQQTRGGSLNESLQLDEAAHMSFKGAAKGEPTRSEHPAPNTSVESTNEGRKDISPQNDQENPKDSTKSMMMATDSDVQPTESRRSTETEQLDDFIFVDFYGTERVQTRSSDPKGKTAVKHREDVDQRQIPMGNPKASSNSQSSKFRRGEMKVTAVPGWSSRGGTAEDQRIDESMGLNGLTDSCEEADEEVATPQDHEPAPEVETEKVLLRTRDKSKVNCRIS